MLEIVDGQAFLQTACVPATADNAVFSQYSTNIIVGPLGTLNGNVTSNTGGSYNIPYRANGIGIFDQN